MKSFMDKDFLLSTETAKHLYHDFAADLPIIDYHCHLNPQEIYEDRRFENITQVWLGGDHYKWRLMRAVGVDERFITGDAPDREKFQKWAETISLAIGNPLFHWSHLELKNYFGYEGVLSGETAEEVWQLCNEKLKGLSARKLIAGSNVKALCTTDDPADSLEWHEKLAGDPSFDVKVLPSYRPDKALGIEKADYLEYLKRLGNIQSFAQLEETLKERLSFFVSLGCRVSDHGLEAVPYVPATDAEVEAIFQKRLSGKIPTEMEQKQFKTALLLALGREYHRLGVVMQLHFGVIRDNSSRVFKALGPDAGIDSIGDPFSVKDLAAFLNTLDETDELPKTILYSLNPNDNAAIETVMACFQGGCFGKLQHGSAWWFNDHKSGMREQLTSLANEGMLCTFVGMLTDSRSFLSYARHEYFRRILCDLIGGWVENGEYPNDPEMLKTPPCVPFGTRRFNRISAETRTGQGYCSIRPVRVFLLKWRGLPWLFPTYANILYGSNHTGMPPIPGLRVSTGSSPSSSAASTASRCTYGSGGAAIHPSSSSCFAYLQFQSSQEWIRLFLCQQRIQGCSHSLNSNEHNRVPCSAI